MGGWKRVGDVDWSGAGVKVTPGRTGCGKKAERAECATRRRPPDTCAGQWRRLQGGGSSTVTNQTQCEHYDQSENNTTLQFGMVF